MSITQKSRWDDAGSEPPGGSAKYTVGEQPIAEYDNWFNKAATDDINALNRRIFDALYPEQQTTPDMTLKINSAKVYFDETPLIFGGGNTPTMTAPTTNPRIDLIVINSAGTLSVIQGSEAASPSPPAYPTDKMPICEVYHRVGETNIKTDDDSTNGYIYRDVRPYLAISGTQGSLPGDTTEAQTWDTVSTLLNNLNRIRKKLNDIIGGSNWYDTVAASLSTVWGKFNASTGHKHSGGANDAPKLPVSSIDTDIATQAELDAHTGASAPHTGHGKITTGSYVGDDTVNRAIAHSMGSTPEMVLLFIGGAMKHTIHKDTGEVYFSDHLLSTAYPVTALDTNNFYVGNSSHYGNSGNAAGQTYRWIAIG